MPGQDLNLALRLVADTRRYVRGMRDADERLRAFGVTTRAADRQQRQLSASVGAARQRVLAYVGSLATLYTAQRGARAIVGYADRYTAVSNAVRLATDSHTAHARVLAGIEDIARETEQPLLDLVDLYERVAISADDLGASERDLQGVLRGVAQALATRGGAASSSGALLQLGQAFSTGIVRAEEFNSLMEGMPAVLRVVARHIDGTGGSVGRLRALVTEGEISSREFFDALLAGLPEIEAEFLRTERTIGGAFQQLDNAMTRTVGAIVRELGVTRRLRAELGGVAEAVEGVDVDALAHRLDSALTPALVGAATWGGALAITLATRTAASFITTSAASIRMTRDIARLDIALATLDGASRRTAITLTTLGVVARGVRGALTFLAGPGGLVLLGAYALYELATASDDAAAGARSLADSLDLDALRDAPDRIERITERLRDMTTAQRQAAAQALDRRLTGDRDLIERLLGEEASIAERMEDALERLQEARARVARLEGPAAGPGNAWVTEGRLEEARRAVVEAEAAVDTVEAQRRRLETERAEIEQISARLALEGADLPLPLPPEAPETRERFDAYGISLEATDAFRRAQEALRTEIERIEDTYARQVALIEANTRAGSEAQAELLARAAATRAQGHAAVEARAELDRERAAQAELRAERERAEAQAERLRREQETGLPALAAARDQLRALRAAQVASSEATAEATAREREQVRAIREYPRATPETIEAIVGVTAAIRAEEQALARRAAVLDRVQRREIRNARALADLESLRGHPDADPERIDAEIARIREAARLEALREGWERELLEREGFQSRIEAQEAAHRERLIAIDYRYAQGVGQTLVLIERFERASGAKRAQAALELAGQTAKAFAGQSEKAFRIAQAAAIAQAVILTIQGVQEAWRSGLQIAAPAPIPQIAAATFAAAAAAQGYARVAAIRAQSPPRAYARGGVISRATFFESREGPGVAGEAGPEAIMPLRRLADGRLGVEAQGAGRALVFAPSTSITVRVEAGADADSGAAERTGRAVAGSIEEQLQPLFAAFLADAQRPGGALNPLGRRVS